MKKSAWVILPILFLTACASTAPQPTPTQVVPTDTIAPPTDTPIPPTPDETADWPVYVNPELGYSLKYPPGCTFGPMGVDCKQNPPEERPPECLCFLNADDPNAVMMQSFLDDGGGGMTLVTFSVDHRDTPAFDPPEGTELAAWLQSEWSYLSEEMPAEPNMTLGGLPALRIYTAGSQQAPSAEHIFVLKDGKLIHINMLDVDVEAHRALYDRILSTFDFGG